MKIVETSPSPFSSAVSPSREVDGLSRIWRLPVVGAHGSKFKVIQIFMELSFANMFHSFQSFHDSYSGSLFRGNI